MPSTRRRGTRRGPRRARERGRSRRSGPRREDVVHQREGCVEPAVLGHAQCADLPTDALEDPRGHRPPGIAGELGRELRGEPRVCVDRVEEAERDTADLVLRRSRRSGGRRRSQRGGDHGFGRGAEQLAFVRHMPVDRPRACGEALGQRPERQPALACRVEQLDGGLDDALTGQRLRSTLRSACPRSHPFILTCLERRSNTGLEQHSRAGEGSP